MRFIVAILMLLLAGCVTPWSYNSDPEEYSVLPENHGLVVFQVVNMNDRLNSYMREWFAFRARRIGGGPITWLEEGQKEPLKYVIYPDFLAIPGTTFWVGVLPEGNYFAEDLYSFFNTGQVYGHMSAPIPDVYASFTIEPGKVTLLDTYLFNGFGETFLMSNIESSEDLIAKAKSEYPKIFSGVDHEHPVRFSAGTREDTAEAFADMAEWAETLGTATYAPDGRIYRPARFGQVFERSPEGEWRRIALDTSEPVLHVFAAADGEAIAVTQGGRAFRRMSADADFVEMPLKFDGQLRNLVRTDNGQWVAAVVRTWTVEHKYGPRKKLTKTEEFHELILSKSARIDTPQWQHIAQLPVETRYAHAIISGNRAIIANAGGFSTAIDLASGVQKKLRQSFAYLRAYDDGRILGYTGYEAGFWGVSAAEIWVSSDYGNTWKKFPDLEAKGMPELIGDDNVLIVGTPPIRGRREALGLKERYEGILSATTDSIWWQKAGVLPDDCTGWIELKQLESGVLALCEFKVFYRENGRAEWSIENMRDIQPENKDEKKLAMARR